MAALTTNVRIIMTDVLEMVWKDAVKILSKKTVKPLNQQAYRRTSGQDLNLLNMEC
jgi:hypothetical protein